MSIRSFFSAKWPELLGVASLVLIAFVILDRFFPLWTRRPIVHLSCFTYRDVNRNGVYDVADRPFAGLKVMAVRPRGRPAERESNISGFANFDMSLGNRQADLYLPGEYTIRTKAPEGWEVTSRNESQTIHLEKRDGTAVGLVAARTIDPVGVAPLLTISGSIAPSLNFATTILKAKSSNGGESVVPATKDGAFSFPATPGKWSLECAASNGPAMIRTVVVDQYPVVVSQINPDRLVFPPKTNLKVIGFDNLTSSDTLSEIPNGYEGLDWRNWVATHQKLYQGSGYINGTVSAEFLAYTSSGHPATVSSPKMFDFVGAYVGVAWPDGEKHDIVVKAWRNDTQVYEDRFRGTTVGPKYFDADYRSVTKVEFASEGYWQITVDDLACRTE